MSGKMTKQIRRQLQKVVLAEAFALVNKDGRQVAKLTLDESGNPALVLFRRGTHARVTLSPQGLGVHDKDGSLRLIVGSTATGTPLISFLDTAGNVQGSITWDNGGLVVVSKDVIHQLTPSTQEPAEPEKEKTS